MVVVAKVRNQMTKARAHKAVKMLTKPCQEVALVIGTATEEAIAVDIPIEVMSQSGPECLVGGVCSPESELGSNTLRKAMPAQSRWFPDRGREVDNPNGRSDRHCDQN